MHNRSTQISIRQATPADAELVPMLNTDVQAIHAAAQPERFKPPDPTSFPAAETRVLLAKDANLVLLAFVDSAPAGYIYAEIVRRPPTSLVHAYETIYVHHISVKPAYRRCSVGIALLNAVRISGSHLGITLLTLDV